MIEFIICTIFHFALAIMGVVCVFVVFCLPVLLLIKVVGTSVEWIIKKGEAKKTPPQEQH